MLVRARRVVKICHACTVEVGGWPSSKGTIAFTMAEMGFTLDDLERLPPGLALPFKESCGCCTDMPSWGLPAGRTLIGRKDLALMYDDAELASVESTSTSRRAEKDDSRDARRRRLGALGTIRRASVISGLQNSRGS